MFQLNGETIPTNNYLISTDNSGLFTVDSNGFIRLASTGLDYESASSNPFQLLVCILISCMFL